MSRSSKQSEAVVTSFGSFVRWSAYAMKLASGGRGVGREEAFGERGGREGQLKRSVI